MSEVVLRRSLPARVASLFVKSTLARVFSGYPGLLASSLRVIASKSLSGRFPINQGLFKGVELGHLSWNTADRISILAGSYEIEVQNWLEANVRQGSRDLLTLGAADGLYAIGLVKAGLARRAFCFESNGESRRNLRRNASLNFLSDDQVRVFGHFYGLNCSKDELAEFVFPDSIFVVDVEGAEYDLFDRDFCKKLSKSVGIIELHDTNDSRLEELFRNLHEFFEVTVLKTGARNPEDFEMLRGLPDDLRWAVMSEGRAAQGRWLALVPKA